MLIAGFPAKFGTNCYVVAPGLGERCVVIDPGHNAMPGVEDILREYRLKPAAVIITHGHVDHMLSVTPVCGAHDIPAYVHPDDRYMPTEPLRGSVFPGMTERELAAMVGQKNSPNPRTCANSRMARRSASAWRSASTWWSTTRRAIPGGR
jgi:glyoxylase-like metal-dependent hydrolase (beta-lactamase superfamily II)